MSNLGQYDPRRRDICLQDWFGYSVILLVKVSQTVPLLDKRAIVRYAGSSGRTSTFCDN